MLIVRSNEYSVIFENVSFEMNPNSGNLVAYGAGLPEKGVIMACYNNPEFNNDHNAKFESNQFKLDFIMNEIITAAQEAKDTIDVFRIPEYIPTKTK